MTVGHLQPAGGHRRHFGVLVQPENILQLRRAVSGVTYCSCKVRTFGHKIYSRFGRKNDHFQDQAGGAGRCSMHREGVFWVYKRSGMSPAGSRQLVVVVQYLVDS